MISESQKKKIDQANLEAQKREKERIAFQDSTKTKSKKIFLAVAVIIIAVVILIGYSAYANSIAPGPYDNFAKCLTEKGAVMYGAIEWCKYTKEQANMFGKSFKFLDYRDYKQGENIKITPTWIINSERYEKVQGFDRLASLTGCSYQ